MDTNFSGINNIDKRYADNWIYTAEDFIQGKENLSKSEVLSIFSNLNIELNEQALEQVENHDGKKGFSKNEFASLFALLDGKLLNGKFNFDGYVEDTSEEGYDPNRNIMNEGSENEISNVVGRFHDINLVENTHEDLRNIGIQLAIDSQEPSKQIAYAKEQGWQNNSANLIKDKNDQAIGRIIISYYEATPGERTFSRFNYRLESFGS